jgi:hypothetical protein
MVIYANAKIMTSTTAMAGHPRNQAGSARPGFGRRLILFNKLSDVPGRLWYVTRPMGSRLHRAQSRTPKCRTPGLVGHGCRPLSSHSTRVTL